MWVFVIVAAVVVLGVVGLGVWMLGPTLRTLLGPSFAPVDKDEASVFTAQRTRMVDGGQ